MKQYEFSTNWFQRTLAVWDRLIPKVNPQKVLEIGSFEGAATCYLIENLAPKQRIEIHCIDTWEGGVEHQAGGFVETNMNAVEMRFKHNIEVASSKVQNNVDLVVHKGPSDIELAKLFTSEKKNYFDFIYVDGSHQAPDVLCDAVLSFRLLKLNFCNLPKLCKVRFERELP
jgi:hypothetical protein